MPIDIQMANFLLAWIVISSFKNRTQDDPYQMVATDIKQFSIRQLLFCVVVFGIGMGLVSSETEAGVAWGVPILVGLTGVFFGYSLMFVSDMIDKRRIDLRISSSRFFNSCALMTIVGTCLLVIFLICIAVLRTPALLLDFLYPTIGYVCKREIKRAMKSAIGRLLRHNVRQHLPHSAPTA